MSETGEHHYIVGAGIAGLATAVFLLRDASVSGAAITIFEEAAVAGGSLDGAGDAEAGYLIRGGRMFEEHFACTFDLLGSIPSADDPGLSVVQDIEAFNRMVPGSGNCRLVKNGKPAEDRAELTLSAQDILDINRLILRPESGLGTQRIEDVFAAGFFDSNFWLMWSTMFSFQPWHSAVEMRRYLRRFIHLFPGFTRIEGILRTRYNQYDSLIAPILTWLRARGVAVSTGKQVSEVEIVGTRQDRAVTSLVLSDDTRIPVAAADQVYMTLGSMTDATTLGNRTQAPVVPDEPGPAWRLWTRLAAQHEGFGRPGVFSSDTRKSAWQSFTVTLDGPDFFEFMEDFTGNRTGTGGLITIADSAWILSFVVFHQPHFRGQTRGTYTFWGYGLRGDRVGDFTGQPMWGATGEEILTELFGHLRLNDAQRDWFNSARVRVSRMPHITSQFMPRAPGDRPDVRPVGARNFAVIGQFCELPRDCVFTVEYSVRSARAAVASLTGRVPPPPPVARTDLDPIVLIRAARVLMGV